MAFLDIWIFWGYEIAIFRINLPDEVKYHYKLPIDDLLNNEENWFYDIPKLKLIEYSEGTDDRRASGSGGSLLEKWIVISLIANWREKSSNLILAMQCSWRRRDIKLVQPIL